MTMTLSAVWLRHVAAHLPKPAHYRDRLGGGVFQAELFVSNLTLQEKAQLVTGTQGPCVGNIGAIPRLGFSGLCLQDGPLAIRQATYASVFPAGLTAAASWDTELMFLRGLYLGAEFKGKGSHIALGPVVGPLGRSPYGGRNWEGFSPDPYLTGVAAERTIQGMQQSGVQACIKHYIGNEQETQRNPTQSGKGMTIEAVSSNIDDRTMHELYLWPFANGVRAGTASVMCSYNRVDSSYGCQNFKILNGLLKTELGFQGYVMSDWQATQCWLGHGHARIGNLLNISFFGGNITRAVNNGTLDEARLDDMVKRIMTTYFYLQQNDYPPIDGEEPTLNADSPHQPQFAFGGSNVEVRDDHATLIRALGAAGTVLLKNTNNTLPLMAPKSIGVFGKDASDLVNGGYFSGSAFQTPFGYEYGNLPAAGGSGAERFSYLVSPLEAIKMRATQDGALVQYILNNTILAGYTAPGSNDGLRSILPNPEVCLVFLKTWASEGSDRTGLEADWSSARVVNSVASYCNKIVVITHSAGLNVMPWAQSPNVTAIFAAHLPGQDSGHSIVDVLYGATNPSGKLPYTIPLKESKYSFVAITNSTKLRETEDPNAWQSIFNEGPLIDYRYFDDFNQSVAFEFGYGLSYTIFDMSDISIETTVAGTISEAPSSVPVMPGGNPKLWQVLFVVNINISNTGSIPGAAIPQVYVSLNETSSSTPTAIRALRGFGKISLQPGEQKPVSFSLMRRDLSYWDTVRQQWMIASGKIGVAAGFSSRDVRLFAEIGILG